MKKAKLIFLALLVVLSLSILIPSTAHASDGGGRQVVKVEHIKVKLNLKHLSASQLKVFRNNTHNQTSLATPNVIAANACAAAPSDHNCDGQDPIYQGCIPSVRPITEVTFYDNSEPGMGSMQMGIVDLKYSNDCKSNWAKGFSGDIYDGGNYGTWEFSLGEVNVVRADGLSEPYYPSGTEGYTNMVYAPVLKAKACIDVWFSVVYPSGGGDAGNTGLMCTAMY